MVKSERLTACELGAVEFFEYLKERQIDQSERAWLDSVMIPGVLGDNPRYYTFWLGVDHLRELIVCEFYFKGEPDENGQAEIGYQVVPAFANMGYTSEMVGLMIDAARGWRELRSLVALVREDNEYSIRIMKKHNFKHIAGVLWRKKV